MGSHDKRITMKTSALLFICIIASSLVGCDKFAPASTALPPKVPLNPPPKEISATDQTLIAEINTMMDTIGNLQRRVTILEPGPAYVDTSELAYSIAKTPFGTFTVVARAVTPFLDGFKVKLQIGNLTAANFNGAKLTVAWGPPFDEKNPNAYAEGQKEKAFELTNRFPAGSSVDVEVALTPAKPVDVKNIIVGIELNQISMPIRR